ncbi:MAG TPA: tetratricopeptide repeat protein [Candidatus Acidoferrum sp.]|nr:tetratricopeptide repeat protein [Candidatus Acidoferrum sp.]
MRMIMGNSFCGLSARAMGLLLVVCAGLLSLQAEDDPFKAALEAARRSHDEKQLQSLKTELEQKTAQDPKDATGYLNLAKVNTYLLDVYEMHKDKKSAVAALDKAIDLTLRSIQLNDKSADAHSLLADLYGRKITYGVAMFAGPKFGPKVKEENAKAMALDDRNPAVWASLGRQYLMAPKMFGGDVAKAIESFQKSLALDGQQDETWVWIAKAFEKQGDKGKAREALQHGLSLNPDSPWVKFSASTLEK